MPAITKKAISLFSVAGVEVEVDYSWLVIFTLVLWSLAAGYFPQLYPGHTTGTYWLVGVVATLLFFASVLIHELSHAMVGNRLGEKVDRITLFIFGGMAHLSGEPKKAEDEIKIAAVGPLSSMVLALVFLVISKTLVMSESSLWPAVFSYLSFINFALALFNLLPGFPLDGGRLLRAVLWKRTGDLQQATARAADWGNTIAWGLIAFGALEIFGGALVGGLWLIFIGLFLRAAASSEYQGTMFEHALRRIRVGDIMTSEPVTLPAELPIRDAVEHYFLRYGFGGFPVVADGHPVGVLSLPQVRECSREDRPHKTVADIMRPLDGVEIVPEASVIEAVQAMNAANSGRLLVIDRGHLAGLITRTGVMRFVQIKNQLEVATT